MGLLFGIYGCCFLAVGDILWAYLVKLFFWLRLQEPAVFSLDGLDGGRVIDEGALLQQGIFIKTLGFMGSEKHREMVNGDTRILIQLMYLESRHVSTRVGDWTYANKNQRSGCVFSQQGLSTRGISPRDSNRFHP